MNTFLNCAYALIITFGLHTAAAESAFTVTDTPQLQVEFKQQSFISSDYFSGPKDAFSNGSLKHFNLDGWLNVSHISGNSPRIKYVKEIGLKKDKLELNVWAQTNPGCGNPLFYEFKTPVKFLKGYSSEITTGVIFGKTRKYVFSGTEPDGKILASNLRFIAVNRDKQPVSIDFNPAGVWNINQGSVSGNCETRWSIKRQGNHYIFSARKIGRNNLGHIFLAKVVFYNGMQEYSAIHPIKDNYYIRPMPKLLFINFGKETCFGASPFGTQTYSEKQQYGWLTEGLKLVATKFNDPIKKEYVTGDQAGVFKIKTIPGRYVLVIQFGDVEKPVGPFDVWINSEKAGAALSSKRGNFKSTALKAVTDKDGILQVKFSGLWAVNALLLQPYLFMTEDYLFERDWWLVKDGLPQLAKVKRKK